MLALEAKKRITVADQKPLYIIRSVSFYVSQKVVTGKKLRKDVQLRV